RDEWDRLGHVWVWDNEDRFELARILTPFQLWGETYEYVCDVSDFGHLLDGARKIGVDLGANVGNGFAFDLEFSYYRHDEGVAWLPKVVKVQNVWSGNADFKSEDSLAKTFGKRTVVDKVSVKVQQGEIVGLLGPNGAGKTTTLRVLAGLLAPTSGTVTVGGHDALTAPIDVRRQVGFLPEGAPAWEEMTVGEHLSFVGRARGLGTSERARAEQRAIEQTGLSDRVRQPIGTLSRGFRQRVGLAAALLHDPPVLLLDEPTTGLDPHQVADLRALVRQLAATRAVLLSTHVLSEVALVCDRVVIMNRGRLVADDDTASVLARTRGRVLTVGIGPGKVAASGEALATELRAIDGLRQVRPLAPDGAVVRLEVHAETDVRASIFAWAVAAGHVLVELTATGHDLEEVFLELTEASGG
ncbi:MAG: ATP-binding cassette domain-containing protein, partial [Myxococcales bacterium]|nr:ATP-binding cassette domain-containing protein [Myxococcales bacterium]